MSLEQGWRGLLPTASQHRYPIFVFVMGTFLVLAPLALVAIGLFSVRNYVLTCFIWLLISAEVFVPSDPDAIWWDRLRWLKAAGWIVLAYVVFERVTAVIQ